MKKSGKSLAGAVISAIATIRVVILIFMAVLVFFVRFRQPYWLFSYWA
jgi:hypothetical protein